MNAIAWGGGFLLLLALPVAPQKPLTIRVAPASVASAPAWLAVRTTVETNEDNRALEVVAESPGFFRGSRVSLDGDRAPRINEVVFKNLPEGQYEVIVTLIGTRGRRAVESRWFHVTPARGR